MVRKIMAIVAIFSGSLALAACNTVEGAGEDIESVAQEVDEET